MGLDMYMYARKKISDPRVDAIFKADEYAEGDGYCYVPGWSFHKDANYDTMVEITGIRPTEESPSFNIWKPTDGDFYHVDATVLYWRKENAIHQWFVENAQGGVDNCEVHSVHHELLVDLLERCEKVVETRDPSSLPTQGGFFFGSTDYDDWYYDGLAKTAAALKRLFSDPATRECTYAYRSSW